MTVHGGWTSHTTRGDGDYEAQKRAALAQSRRNDFAQGIQTVQLEGIGRTTKGSRDNLGAVNKMTNELVQGQNSGYSAQDVPGNAPLANPQRTTGNVDLGISATKIPQQDPEEMSTAALDAKLATMARGGMQNLNSIPNIYPRRA